MGEYAEGSGVDVLECEVDAGPLASWAGLGALRLGFRSSRGSYVGPPLRPVDCRPNTKVNVSEVVGRDEGDDSLGIPGIYWIVATTKCGKRSVSRLIHTYRVLPYLAMDSRRMATNLWRPGGICEAKIHSVAWIG